MIWIVPCVAGCDGPMLTTTWFGSAVCSSGLLTGERYCMAGYFR